MKLLMEYQKKDIFLLNKERQKIIDELKLA